MNKYKFMTCTLVVSNVVSLVAMFIAAFWGFTYPTIIMDDYESGKSAIVATFMCVLSCICLCGLNYQNYYLLIVYGCVHILVMFNQMFSVLPFSWTRIPNYPLIGNVSTQIYVLAVPKIILVIFSFMLAFKLRQDEVQRRISRQDPRCRCDSSRSTASTGRPSLRSYHNTPIMECQGGMPPPLPPPNAIIRTPPLYPMHRPSLSNPPLPSLQPPMCRTPPLHGPINGPMSGPPGTPPWRTNERKWTQQNDRSRDYERHHYYRDVYNPNY